MAKVGAQRAAELTGKSKSTIQRAMEAGKLSFEVAENGRRVIDVSELERVFGLSTAETEKNRKKPSTGMANVAELERAQIRAKSLEDQMFLLNQQVEDLKGQRDSWQKQAQQLAITHQTTQEQASTYKTQVDEYKSKADAEKDRAEAAARKAEDEARKAEEYKTQLDDLKKIAAQMKQKIVSHQTQTTRVANRPANAAGAPAKAKPKTLLGLLGFGGR